MGVGGRGGVGGEVREREREREKKKKKEEGEKIGEKKIKSGGVRKDQNQSNRNSKEVSMTLQIKIQGSVTFTTGGR